MKTIKYSLYDNAISSFFIAKKNFSRFYYNSTEPLTEEMLNEYAKIGLVFLENSIELMLKAILSVDDPKCIYKEPESRAITKALSLVTETRKLEDILINNCNFKTKTYYEVVDLYVSKYNMPVKVKDILNILGDKRNAITHFGIDESNSYSELIACFINTFDVIYNYLYPMLRKLNDIGHYFTDDMFYMSYLGEYEFFYNPNDNSYNNIIDFLDELLGGASSFVFELRKSNNEFNIAFFIDILHQVIEDKSFNYSLSNINTTISCEDFFDTDSPECRFINIDYHKQYYEYEDIYFLWSYSIYYNFSYFAEETTGLLFVIDHKKNKIYYYDGSINFFPEYNKPEKEIDVNNDIANNKCKELNLSKRNLRTVLLEQIIKFKEKLELMEVSENGQT